MSAVTELWGAVEVLSLVADLSNQRDKMLVVNGSMRKELETVKKQLVDALAELDAEKRKLAIWQKKNN